MRKCNPKERFLTKFTLDRETGCWNWTAGKSSNGYGAFWWNNQQWPAHRAGWMLFVGPIPKELHIDHLCRNRACVNWAHLELVTPQANILRGETVPAANVLKTHCPYGHPYDEANTCHRRGRRCCRHCARDRARAKRRADPDRAREMERQRYHRDHQASIEKQRQKRARQKLR